MSAAPATLHRRRQVARAEPDGYTLLIGQWGTQVVNPVTYNLPCNAVNEHAQNRAFDQHAAAHHRREQTFRPATCARADQLDQGQSRTRQEGRRLAGAIGACTSRRCMYFQQVTGTRFGFVPYRGGAPAMART